MKRLLRLFRPHRARIVLISLLIVGSSALGVGVPLLLQVMLDDGLMRPGGPDVAVLVTVLGLMAGVLLLTSLLGVVEAYETHRMGHRVMEALRVGVYSNLQRMSMSFFTRTRSGEIQSRLANDVGSVQDVVGSTFPSMIAAAVTSVTMLVTMGWLSWRLTLVSLVLLPLVCWLTARAADYQRKLATALMTTKADMSVIVEETLSVSGVLLAKVFGRSDHGLRRFGRESRRLSRLQLKAALAAHAMLNAMQGTFALIPAAIYLAVGIGEPMTYGELTAFVALQSKFFMPVGRLLQISVQLRSATALFERIHEYLDLVPDIVDRPGALAVRPDEVKGCVQLSGVSFGYGEAPALEQVSLTIRPGQFAAIVGGSGSGKTTLAHLLLRLYDPDRGAVLIDGMDLRDLTAASVSGLFGVVTQETHLFHASIAENLRFGKPQATEAEIQDACRAAMIHDRIMALPEGYDTVVGERGFLLSGGERQRLAIARAVLRSPRILLLDEATSALDPENERLVQAALRPLMAGRTTIAIAHRLSTVAAADVIFVLDRGRLVEHGTHAELVAAGGRYAELHASTRSSASPRRLREPRACA
ncbi:ABC transporter ATP-binding protein [Nonomuraea sp. NPDC050663]|uniref:ABC transporter ATP-binding protein n=1 Tax=Nonomuraea sp. NPDC050663 TaxID=3364370 RepID=UPI00378B9258